VRFGILALRLHQRCDGGEWFVRVKDQAEIDNLQRDRKHRCGARVPRTSAMMVLGPSDERLPKGPGTGVCRLPGGRFDMKKGSGIRCDRKPKGVELGVVAQRWHRSGRVRESGKKRGKKIVRSGSK
jgi:hypothetical protein